MHWKDMTILAIYHRRSHNNNENLLENNVEPVNKTRLNSFKSIFQGIKFGNVWTFMRCIQF